MSDDERIERARRFAEDMRRMADEQRTAEMEASLAETPSTRDGIPMPSTCHPYYAQDKALILSWLNGTLSYGSRDHLTIPRRPVFKAADFFKPIEPQATLKTDELDRRRIRAPAPYVGEPYMLSWYVAEDRFGRTVAGEIGYEFLHPWTHRGGAAQCSV